MVTTRFVSLFLSAACLSACSSTDQNHTFLNQAAQFHQQATKLQQEVEPRINEIYSLKRAVLAKKLPNASARVATLDSLKTAFEEWEENLVEVPGMPRDHSHEHGDHRADVPAHHHHTDATLKDLPADQMRDLQREMLSNLRQIQIRLDQVIQINYP